MEKGNTKILTVEEEKKLRQPIDEFVGIDKVISLQNTLDGVKRDRSLTQGEKENRIATLRTEIEMAKGVDAKNKDEISKLIAEAEAYLKEHFDEEYYKPVKESCDQEKVLAKEKYNQKLVELKKEHEENLKKLSDSTFSWSQLSLTGL